MLKFDSGLKIIGVLGVPDLGSDDTIHRVEQDLGALQEGGVDALLIENLGDTITSYADLMYAATFFGNVLAATRSYIHIPFGIALLPHEYKKAFEFAEEFNADFVWFDTFVDPIRPTYTPIRVTLRPNPAEIVQHKTRPIFAEVQPANFYELLEERPIEESAQAAMSCGADSITVVRGGTYQDDTLERVRQKTSPNYPLGITGSLNPQNIGQYAGRAQYAVVYGALRQDGEQENPVDMARVKEFMSAVR